MFPRAIRIGSVGGVDVRVDPSWGGIVLLFGFAFFGQFAIRFGHPTLLAVGLALLAVALFFLSVLAHEVAHALEATHRGVAVGGITLFLFGGVTETDVDVRRPWDEFALSAVGPYASFVAAAIFGLVATGARDVGWRAIADVAGLVGWLNLLLGAFNLLPGAPLDGGRIVRAAAWRLTGDRARSVRIAARWGQVIGGLIVLGGLYQAWVVQSVFIGIFNAVIGWFLWRAATAEIDQVTVRALLGTRTLGEVVGSPPDAVDPNASLAQAARTLLRSASVHPVTRDGELLGAVSITDVSSVSGDHRRSRVVADVMRPVAALREATDDLSLTDALDRIGEDEVLAVHDAAGALVGFASRAQLGQAAARIRALEDPAARRRRWRRG